MDAYFTRSHWNRFRAALAALLGCVLLCLTSAAAQSPGGAAKLNFAELRVHMVKEDLEAQGIKDKRVLQAFRDVPRHEFVSPVHRASAYYDMAIPIGESQTISAPFVVAYMTEQLDPQPTDKVLEIGTGSGYQAAILSPLVKEVYSIEIVESLGLGAKKVLDRLKFKNVTTKIGDGYLGWAEHAPFDKIIVTCSPEKVPQPLVDQLKEGGRMIVPVGERYQQVLYLMRKTNGKLERELLRPTLFVPMTGKAEAGREVRPDPLRPKLRNGGFEDLAGASKEPVAWYYQRQMEVLEDAKSPEGKRFIRFTNDTPGRQTRMMQGLGIDGRKVPAIEITIQARGKNIRAGQSEEELPAILITYFDENRARLGTQAIGPFRGTFDWREEQQRFEVPPQTREAIVSMGLYGGTGEIDFDAIQLHALPAKGK